MLVTKFIEIDMGHRVPNHKSKCSNMHGHRYKIEVGVDDQVIATSGVSDEGMVIDFGDLKEIMMAEIDAKLDHGFMVYREEAYAPIFKEMAEDGQKIIFVDFIPTAENIAKYLYGIMREKLLALKIKLDYVLVYETPTSTAKFTEKDFIKLIM